MVAIVDYGMGNLASVSGALAELGVPAIIARQPSQLAAADRLILPGVGSFAEGMANLNKHGWVDAIHREVESGKPLLGICLGMQLLASRGTEGGENEGLNLIPGEVKRLDTLGCNQRIPHVGWNSVRVLGHEGGLFAGIPDATDFYFVHSFAFHAAAAKDVRAEADYGVPFPAAVGCGHVSGTQFHPEKSSRAGFRLLRNFLDLK